MTCYYCNGDHLDDPCPARRKDSEFYQNQGKQMYPRVKLEKPEFPKPNFYYEIHHKPCPFCGSSLALEGVLGFFGFASKKCINEYCENYNGIPKEWK